MHIDQWSVLKLSQGLFLWGTLSHVSADFPDSPSILQHEHEPFVKVRISRMSRVSVYTWRRCAHFGGWFIKRNRPGWWRLGRGVVGWGGVLGSRKRWETGDSAACDWFSESALLHQHLMQGKAESLHYLFFLFTGEKLRYSDLNSSGSTPRELVNPRQIALSPRECSVTQMFSAALIKV